MSPSILILFALLLTLISGSTEGGWGTDSVALLRQTLRYWRKIYNTYHEEVTLGYCWADYLVQISVELSTNPSASLFATGDRSNTTAWATKSQRNPFPENVMADATQHGETLGGHLREKRSHATARSTISEFMKDPNGHRIATGWKITGKRERWMTNEAGQGVAAGDTREGADKTNEDESFAAMTDSYVERRRALPIARSNLLREGRQSAALRYEFPSRGASWRIVNPTLNPKDDDEVDWGASRDHVEEGTCRKVLRAPTTTSHRGPFIGDASRPGSFSLKLSRARHRKSLGASRFRLRRHPPSRERTPTVNEPLSAVEDHRASRTSDPEGRGVPLNNDEKPPTPSLSQFRRANLRSDDQGSTDAVKLMDSKGNSSQDSTWPINSWTPRRKRGKSSRHSPLSPRGRSPLESQQSTEQMIGDNFQPRSKMGEGDMGERRPRRKKRSPYVKNVLPVHFGRRTNGFPLEFGRSRQRAPSENRSALYALIIPPESSLRDEDARITNRALSPSRVERFLGIFEDNEVSTVASTKNSGLCVLGGIKQRSLQLLSFLPDNIRTIVIGVLWTLGIFVHIGRQIIDIVDSNIAIRCTKEYLWLKIERWLDT